MRRFSRACLVVTALAAAACGGADVSSRRLAAAPTERLLARPLPAGVAETALAISSDGAPAPGGGGLVWIVANDTREYVYAVASCRTYRLSEPEADALATLHCDGDRYDVAAVPGRIELRRSGEVLASFGLPSGWRARARTD